MIYNRIATNYGKCFKNFDINITGMEAFGSRQSTPLQKWLNELGVNYCGDSPYRKLLSSVAGGKDYTGKINIF